MLGMLCVNEERRFWIINTCLYFNTHCEMTDFFSNDSFVSETLLLVSNKYSSDFSLFPFPCLGILIYNPKSGCCPNMQTIFLNWSQREEGREEKTSIVCLLQAPPLGIELIIWVGALTGNQTTHFWCRGLCSNQLNHISLSVQTAFIFGCFHLYSFLWLGFSLLRTL